MAHVGGQQHSQQVPPRDPVLHRVLVGLEVGPVPLAVINRVVLPSPPNAGLLALLSPGSDCEERGR